MKKALTPEQADRHSLMIVKKHKTGKVTPRIRPDGLHDFVVNGLVCSACGGEIIADDISEYYIKDGVKFGGPDGVIWRCKYCCLEVNEHGNKA